MIERMQEILHAGSTEERTKLILGKLPVFTQKFESVGEMENAMVNFMRTTNSPKREIYVKTIKDFYSRKEYSKAVAGGKDKLLDKFVDDYILPYLSKEDLPTLPELGEHLTDLISIAVLNDSEAEKIVQDCVLENHSEYIRKDMHWLRDLAITTESAALLSHRVISNSHTVNDLSNGLHVVAQQVWLVLLTRFRCVYGLQDKPVTRSQIILTINHTMSMLEDLYPEMCSIHKEHLLDLDTIFEQASAINAARYINSMYENNLAEDAKRTTTKDDVASALQTLIDLLGKK